MSGSSKGAERTEREVLEAVERRRRRAARRVVDERITLSHGAGGKSTQALIEGIFLRELANPLLAPLADSAIFEADGTTLAISTDSYVVRPLFFPGGDIGEVAVNGTVNDLAMAGARPLVISAAFIVEEGLEMADLERIVASLAASAEAAGVPVAAGDTKVVERGNADGVYINTTGVGIVPAGVRLAAEEVRIGDRIIVSGSLGEHGLAVMVARGDLALEVELESDTAPLADLVQGLLATADGVRWLRDPTRGGVATVLVELALAAEVGIAIDEAALPVRPEVNAACEILGIDPLYVACEGRLVAVVAPDAADAALAALRADPLGGGATVIGEVRADSPGMVVLETTLGGNRVVDMLAGDPLPRIC